MSKAESVTAVLAAKLSFSHKMIQGPQPRWHSAPNIKTKSAKGKGKRDLKGGVGVEIMKSKCGMIFVMCYQVMLQREI